MGKHSKPKGSAKKSNRAQEPEFESNLRPIDTNMMDAILSEDDVPAYEASQADDCTIEDETFDTDEPTFDPFVPSDEQPAYKPSKAVEAAASPAAARPQSPLDVTDPELAKYQRGKAQYKRHSHRGRNIAIAVAVVVVLIFGGVAGAAFAFWNGTQAAIQITDNSIKEELSSTVSTTEPFWTLVLGSDERSEPSDVTGQRSDVILLARIDPQSKQVTFVSIPRDSLIYINGHKEKINAAYSLGGAKQAIKTVEEYAGINIDHYIELNFEGFSSLVDSLGGITVDVPEYASYDGVTLYPGENQWLDGEHALMLARNRKTYAAGDFTRTQCQRLLAEAVIAKVLEKNTAELATLVPSIAQCFKTDMPLGDIVALANAMQGMGKDEMYMAMCPSTAGMLGEVSYTFTYIDQWKLMMMRAKNGEDPTVTDAEAALLGTASTQTDKLDMTKSLSETTLKKIQALKDEEKAAEVSGQSTTSTSSSTSASTTSKKQSSEDD